MATHDYVLANQSGSSFRSDLNNALAAIVSQNSSATEPATKYAYQYWIDTSATPALVKQRNAANNAWVTLAEVDGQTLAADGTNAKPGISFAADINCGLRRNSADNISIITGGTQAITVDSSQNATFAGDVKAGERDPSSTTTRGVRVAIDSNNGGCYVQAKSSATASSLMAFQALHGTTENFKVTYDGAATFANYIDVGNGGTFFRGGSAPAVAVKDSNDSNKRTAEISANGTVKIGGTLPSSPNITLDLNGTADFTGITFNGDTGAANTLDDYEEGTWTPVFAGGTTAGTYTYGTQTGKYTKIGNKVTVWCELLNIATGSAGSGAARITGLPFTSGGGVVSIGTLLLDDFNLTSTSIRGIHSQVTNLSTQVLLRATRNGLTDTNIAVTDKDSDTADLSFCVTYPVS